LKNTIENKISDESNKIKQKNSRLFIIKKNTIKDKINDESEVIEQKKLRFSYIEEYNRK